MADLTGVLGVLARAQEQVASTKADLQGAYGGLNDATGAKYEAAVRAKRAEAVIQGQKDIGELQAQQNTRLAATALGTNMDEPTQIVTLLGNKMREAALASVAQAAKVADLEANNDLFLNPLGFLRDFAVGDKERAKLLGAVGQLETATDALNKLNNATQSTAQTQRAIAETKSMATVQAGQELLAAQAAELAATGRMAMAGNDIALINSLSSLDATGTSYAIQAYNIQIQEEQRAWARAQKEAAAASEDALLRLRNLGAAEFGFPEIDDLKSERLINKDRQDWLVQRGMLIEQAKNLGTEIPPPVWGSNAISALQNKRDLGFAPTPAEQHTADRVRRLASEALNADKIAEMLLATGMVSSASGGGQSQARIAAAEMLSTREGRAQAMEDYINYKQQQYVSSPFSDTDLNPYAPPPLTIIEYPELQTNPFLLSKVTPLIEAAKSKGEVLTLDPNYLFRAGIDAAYKEGINMSDVVTGISSLSQQLEATSNLTRNYRGLGMPVLNGLTASITTEGFSGNINLSNPADVQAALVRAWERGGPNRELDRMIMEGLGAQVR